MEFADGVARKSGSPSVLAVERAKTERAAHIGAKTGLFDVPRIVSFDADRGVLESEHLLGLHNLLALAADGDDRIADVASRAGEALAAVHARLVLPPESRYDFPPEWMAPPGDNVFVHGDFTAENVCFHEPTGRLVIVDWSTAPFLDRVPTFGSRYFDVTWFVLSLYYSGLRKRIASRQSRAMADAFLGAYARAAGPAFAAEDWRHYHRVMSRLHRRIMRHGLRRLAPIRNLVFVLAQTWVHAQWMGYRPRGLARDEAVAGRG